MKLECFFLNVKTFRYSRMIYFSKTYFISAFITTTKKKNANDRDHKLSHSGIYILCCNNCLSFYIGKTIRNIKSNFSEHRRCFNYNNFPSIQFLQGLKLFMVVVRSKNKVSFK